MHIQCTRVVPSSKEGVLEQSITPTRHLTPFLPFTRTTQRYSLRVLDTSAGTIGTESVSGLRVGHRASGLEWDAELSGAGHQAERRGTQS